METPAPLRKDRRERDFEKLKFTFFIGVDVVGERGS
tara:strand:- start:338 stop:445 length:108 start_codon:yes stop_codon:yes gene_type:complete